MNPPLTFRTLNRITTNLFTTDILKLKILIKLLVGLKSGFLNIHTFFSMVKSNKSLFKKTRNK